MEKTFKGTIITFLGLVLVHSILMRNCLVLAKDKPEEIEYILQEIDEKQKAVKTFSAEFIQTKKFEIMSDEIITSGRVYFERPDRMFWEYKKPDRFNILIKNQVVYIYTPESNKIKKYKFPAKKAPFPAFSFSHPVEQLKKDYKISIMTNVLDENQYSIELTPISKRLKKYFRKVEILVDEKNYLLNKIKMFDQNGDLTEIVFFNIKLNQKIKEEIFNKPIR